MATKIVRDNCKDCTSGCEHAGKDREFVCVKGVSCKTVKPKLEMVAVVRCKDCKHKDTWQESKIRDWFWCGVSGLQVVEDMDFCSYGERRTDFVDDNKIGERKTDE